MIDKNKLPKLTNDIVEKVLVPSMPRANKDSLVLLVLYTVSKILCYNRVRIRNDIIETRDTSPNIYAMSLSHSGVGKDKSKRVIKELMSKIIKDMNRRQVKWFEGERERVEEESKVKHEGKSKQKEFVAINSPRTLRVRIDSNATPEGFYSQREAYYKAGFGCTSWEDSEIFDSIEERGANGTFGGLTSSVKQAYDHGFTEAKITKGEKYTQDIDGVPNLMFVHGACGDEYDISYLKKFFDLGFARRCLIFLEPRGREYKRFSIEERRALIEKKRIGYEEIEEELFNIYENTKFANIFILTEKAEDACIEYEEDNGELAYKASSGKGIKADYRGRDWRMIKLAAVIAVQRSDKERNTLYGEHYVITEEYIQTAIYIINYYGKYFEELYLSDSQDLIVKFIEFVSKKPRTLNDIAGSSIFAGDRSKRLWLAKKFLAEDSTLGVLDERGLYLTTAMGGKTKKCTYYQVKKIPEHMPVDSAENVLVNITVATHNNGKTPSGYENYFQCNFSELHNYICQENSWTPKKYEKGYREGDNRVKGENLLVFDIDNDSEDPGQWLTMKEAHARYSQYVHLIIPTKSHLKQKGDKPARSKFRIIFPTSSPMNMSNRHRKLVVESCARELQLHYPKGICDINATARSNEAWVGALGTPTYNLAGKLFNWRMGGYRSYLNKDMPKQKRNSIDPHTIVRIKNQDYTVQQAMSYVMGHPQKKTPCNCPFHDDTNASAWLQINDNGNMVVACSAGCESKYFDVN